MSAFFTQRTRWSYVATLVLALATAAFGWDPYPYNPQIHMLGNQGLLGRIHAEVAPTVTRLIDEVVYETDVRKEVLERETAGRRVLDLGCGVGFSTSSSEGSVGVDTSRPMIEKAKELFPDKEFSQGHAEWCGFPEREFDVVTIMYLFHEAPQSARRRIIEHARRIAKEKIVIVDISPDYIPSQSMLAGEPYLIDYLSNIKDDLRDFDESVLVPGHVHCWTEGAAPR